MSYTKTVLYSVVSLFIISCVLIFWRFFYFSTTSLPKPTGPYAVGATALRVTDKSRKEMHIETDNFRELMLQIFYPAQPSGKKAPYLNPRIIEVVKADLSKMTGTSVEELSYLDALKSHSFENVQVASDQQMYPILIFSPGWGTPTNLYSSLLEDLASHGFIVVGINYPYVTNPVELSDGNIVKSIERPKDPVKKREVSKQEIKIWVQDIKFVIDELEKFNNYDSNSIFKNKLDTKRIGIFGHSFGGSVAVQACKYDQRCVAGADIEGKLYDVAKLNKPFMFIMAPHAQEALQPIKDLSKDSKVVSYFEVSGTNHGSFTDLYLIAKFKKEILPALDPTQGIQGTRKLLREFFDEYVKKSIL